MTPRADGGGPVGSGEDVIGRTRAARLVDVAEAAGVSISSASRARNGRGGVSHRTRARVVVSAAGLGYWREENGAVLALSRTRPGGPTTSQVAAAAHVSVATVSRVVNHQVGVSDPTRRRVEDVVAALGYRLREAALGLARGRTSHPQRGPADV